MLFLAPHAELESVCVEAFYLQQGVLDQRAAAVLFDTTFGHVKQGLVRLRHEQGVSQARPGQRSSTGLALGCVYQFYHLQAELLHRAAEFDGSTWVQVASLAAVAEVRQLVGPEQASLERLRQQLVAASAGLNHWLDKFAGRQDKVGCEGRTAGTALGLLSSASILLRKGNCNWVLRPGGACSCCAGPAVGPAGAGAMAPSGGGAA